MKKCLVLMLISATVLFVTWTSACADDDDHNRLRTDFALFDGTNPTTEAPPAGGAECFVKGPATLLVSVTAHASGPAGYVRFTFEDGDWVQFPIASGGVLQLTQAIGGTKGVSRRIRVSNGNVPDGPRLVGMMSVISGEWVFCQSCNFDDAAGSPGCRNNP